MIQFKKINPDIFSGNLLNWWNNNKRRYPWRLTRDPYKILISEVLLHRTRADQVVPIYQEFIDRFPSITELSNATSKEMCEILLPLGLYWRTTLLSKMVKSIVIENGGEIPSNRTELERLPGIGPYISSAIMCFAYDSPEAILDTNVVRILGRVTGVKVTDGSRRSKYFQHMAGFFLDKNKPRDFNYALLDLGALVCLPKKPLCNCCPLNYICEFSKTMGL